MATSASAINSVVGAGAGAADVAATGVAADLLEAAPQPETSSRPPAAPRKMTTHTTTIHTAAEIPAVEIPPVLLPPFPCAPVGAAIDYFDYFDLEN